MWAAAVTGRCGRCGCRRVREATGGRSLLRAGDPSRRRAPARCPGRTPPPIAEAAPTTTLLPPGGAWADWLWRHVRAASALPFRCPGRQLRCAGRSAGHGSGPLPSATSSSPHQQATAGQARLDGTDARRSIWAQGSQHRHPRRGQALHAQHGDLRRTCLQLASARRASGLRHDTDATGLGPRPGRPRPPEVPGQTRAHAADSERGHAWPM